MSDRWIQMLTLGMWQANCYVVGDGDRAFVVDPGQDGAGPVKEQLAGRGARCEAILLTHGHLDHVWAMPELARDLDVPVLLHAEDRWLWDDPAAAFGTLPPGALQAQFGLDWDPPTERLDTFADGTRLAFAGYAITARHTPGHTPGSSVFLLGDGMRRAPMRRQHRAPNPQLPLRGPDPSAPLLLSGDLVFAGSVGRTDFPRGSWAEQMDSIHRVVLPLDDTVEIHSGHGPATTVGPERRTNPYLAEAARQ